jgi:hypothetical protein
LLNSSAVCLLKQRLWFFAFIVEFAKFFLQFFGNLDAPTDLSDAAGIWDYRTFSEKNGQMQDETGEAPTPYS